MQLDPGIVPLEDFLVEEALGQSHGLPGKLLKIIVGRFPAAQDCIGVEEVGLGEEQILLALRRLDDVQHDVQVAAFHEPQELVPGRSGDIVDLDADHRG